MNITTEQSLTSIRNSLELFKDNGIKAEYIVQDTSKYKTDFTPRVKNIQRDIRASGRALCIETSKLKTKYYRKFKNSADAFLKSSVLNFFRKPVNCLFNFEIFILLN